MNAQLLMAFPDIADVTAPEQSEAEVRRTLRPESVPFGLLDLTDDGLRRVRRDLLIRTSDLARDGRIEDAQKTWAEAYEIRAHQLSRFRLRMRYGAVDDHLGTAVYDRWYRHNEPPTYRFAAAMDQARAVAGSRHCLDWTSLNGRTS